MTTKTTPHKTFKIKNPAMKGPDVRNWQRELKNEFSELGIEAPVVVDGTYGVATRSFTASLCYALGIDPGTAMEHGVTPDLRTKLRHRQLTDAERKRFNDRKAWRKRLAERYGSTLIEVHRPVTKIVEDSWGYHPGVHDGLDVITLPNARLFAMVKSKVIDVRASGWWGLGAPKNAQLKAKGDGIVQFEILDNIGPFVKGRHIAYGHAEHAIVRVGDIVDAGDPVCRAGFANAWHIHLMYNDGLTTKGIGNINPRAIVDYAVKHG